MNDTMREQTVTLEANAWRNVNGPVCHFSFRGGFEAGERYQANQQKGEWWSSDNVDLDEPMTEDFKAAWKNGIPLDSMEAKWAFVGWREAQRQGGEDADYDDACETILEGAADVAKAVGLDGEFFCGEGAFAAEISRGLSQIAEVVTHMPELYGSQRQGVEVVAYLRGVLKGIFEREQMGEVAHRCQDALEQTEGTEVTHWEPTGLKRPEQPEDV